MKITSQKRTENTGKKDGLYFDDTGIYKVKSNIKTFVISNGTNAE